MNFQESAVLLELALDVDFLRKSLIPGYDLCFNRGSWSHVNRDLRDISKLHGAKLRISHSLSMEDSLGTFSDDSSIITVLSSYKDRLELDDMNILTVFTHELGHAIQFRLLENIPIEHQNKFFSKFSNVLVHEQTAERLALHIARNYFPSLCKKHKLTKGHFRSYFRRKDIISLAKYYGRHEDEEDVKNLLILNGFKV